MKNAKNSMRIWQTNEMIFIKDSLEKYKMT